MENLNDDEVGLILKRVINRIDRKSCAKVCSQWRRLEASTRESLKVLDSQLLNSFLPRYKNLLTLQAEGEISDFDLELIAETCPALQNLNLNYDILKTMSYNGGTLPEFFSLDTPSDVGLCSIANGCRDLRKVYLKRRKGLGNVGATSLMKSCPNIMHLDLGFCNRITDQALEAIGASNCLEVLVLNGCKLVSDRGLMSLASGSTATTLKRLDLSYCDQITDMGVSLLQHLSCLQMLNLEGCGPGVTDAGGVDLGAILTLEKINFSWLINISDVSLLAIARHCSDLKEIKVTGCESVTGDGVCAFSQHVSLEAMILDGCSNVHSEDIEQMVLGCPTLSYLGLDRDLRHWIPASVIERIDGRCRLEWL